MGFWPYFLQAQESAGGAHSLAPLARDPSASLIGIDTTRFWTNRRLLAIQNFLLKQWKLNKNKDWLIDCWNQRLKRFYLRLGEGDDGEGGESRVDFKIVSQVSCDGPAKLLSASIIIGFFSINHNLLANSNAWISKSKHLESKEECRSAGKLRNSLYKHL